MHVLLNQKNRDAALIDLLETGTEVVVSQGAAELARIGLDGAAGALDGVDACLTP